MGGVETMELNKFYLGDCLEIIKTLPSDSIDLIVTSPPYADKRKTTYGGVHADEYVVLGDCLEKVKDLKENSMDLIIMLPISLLQVIYIHNF
jgi:DNA modification methylase